MISIPTIMRSVVGETSPNPMTDPWDLVFFHPHLLDSNGKFIDKLIGIIYQIPWIPHGKYLTKHPNLIWFDPFISIGSLPTWSMPIQLQASGPTCFTWRNAQWFQCSWWRHLGTWGIQNISICPIGSCWIFFSANVLGWNWLSNKLLGPWLIYFHLIL